MKTSGFYNMENLISGIKWIRNIPVSANLWIWSCELFVQTVRCFLDHHKACWRTWLSGFSNVCGVHAARLKQMDNKPNAKKECAWYSKQPLMSLLPHRTFLKRKLQFLGPDRTGQMCAVTCLFLSVRGNGRRKREGKKEDVRTGKGKAEMCLKSKMEIQHTPHLVEHEQSRGVREEKMEKWEESCLSLMCALNVYMINDVTLQNLYENPPLILQC